MPDIHRLRVNLISGMQELAGINESMLGQVKREMSGFSIQTAIDAGNTVRRRLFNKYTKCVKDTFRMYLACARVYWTEARTIAVIGKERAFESADFSGADIDGGFDGSSEVGRRVGQGAVEVEQRSARRSPATHARSGRGS